MANALGLFGTFLLAAGFLGSLAQVADAAESGMAMMVAGTGMIMIAIFAKFSGGEDA